MKTPIDLYNIGEHLHFNDSRETTNGKRSEGILTVGTGKSGPPPHRHMMQEEGFEVISGEMIHPRKYSFSETLLEQKGLNYFYEK